MNGVMDSVKAEFFSAFCKVGFACGCAVFSFYAHFKVLFGAVGNNFAEQFSKFSSMFCFFKSSFFPVQADFRITFTESNAAHSKVHAYFAAFAVEVSAQVFFNIFGNVFSYANKMFSSPGHFAFHFYKFGSRSFALRAVFRSSFTFINIATNLANPFFHYSFLHKVQILKLSWRFVLTAYCNDFNTVPASCQ